MPEPWQFFVVQKHHEVGQDGVAIHTTVANLTHQVHAHGIAAQRKEGGVTQTQDAAVAPHQIHRNRQQAITQILAEQGHGVSRQVERRSIGNQQVRNRHHDTQQQ